MKVFAIADLHLPGAGSKPMDVFGPKWGNHAARIADNWRGLVSGEDLVLLPGDLSWAMRLQEARDDLALIESLPGMKVLIHGNHDYWCGSPGKVRAALGPTTRLIRFDALAVGDVAVCGVRAWLSPGHPDYDPETDARHWARARVRLRMSLEALAGIDHKVAIAMFHYPPIDACHTTVLCEMVREAGVSHVVYGHVHGEALADIFEGERDGVHYRCVSADHVGFAPVRVM